MRLQATLRGIIYLGAFLVPFIPLLVTQSMYFPFITGKHFAFRIIVEVMLAAWVLLALADARVRPRLHGLLVAIAGFVGIIAIADIFGENPFKSIWSNFERMEGLVTLVHLLAYFLVLGTTFYTQKLWRLLAYTTLGVSAIIGIYGVLQFFGVLEIHQSSARLDATLGNATYLAVYMLFHIFIAGLLLVREAAARGLRHILPWLFAALVVFQALILFGTATRGAMLGLIGGVLVTLLGIALFDRARPVWRKRAAGALAVLIVLAGAFVAARPALEDVGGPVGRLASISLESGETRLTIWSMAWEGVKERPVLGWGQENFNFVFNKHYRPELYNQEPWFDRVHNIVFDWLIAGGVLGLAGYLSIFIAALYCLWLSRRGSEVFTVPEKSVLTGLFAGYFFHNLFVFDNIVSYILFFSVLAYIFARTRHVPKERSQRAPGHTLLYRAAVPVVVLALAGTLYFVNVRPMQASTTLIDAIRTTSQSPRQSLQHFNEALSYNTIGMQEIRERFAQSARGLARRDIALDTKKAFFERATRAMQAQIQRVPNDARTRIIYGSLLLAYQQHEQALAQFRAAQELTPKKQQPYFMIAQTLLRQGNPEQALSAARRGFALVPESDAGRELYAAVAIYAGKQDRANEILQEGFGTTTVDSNDLLRAYRDTGQHKKVAAILEQRVRQNPGNFQNHVSLAAAYLQLGKRTQAINEMRAAIRLNPDLRAQGERIIKDIREGNL